MTVEYAGSQFLDPRILDISRQQSENSSEYARIQAFDANSSPQHLSRDVDQAVRPQNEPSSYGSALEGAPSTPTNLSRSRPLLNPLARPFYPPPTLETPPTHGSLEIAHHRMLAATQAIPLQPYQYHQLQAIAHSSPQQNGAWNSNTLGSPFNPHMGSGSEIQPASQFNFGPYFQQANDRALGPLPAIAMFQGEDQAAHDAGNGITLLPSAENVARVPGNQDPFQAMQQWNRTTYQGPVAAPSHPQLPPTPASSGRRRRVGSVAVSTQTGTGTFQCNGCTRTFTKKHLRAHHQRWHEKSFKCGVCDKPFTVDKDRRRHFKAIHTTDEKHLFCNIMGCKYSHVGFHRMDHLKRHNQRVHPGNPWTPPATASNAGG